MKLFKRNKANFSICILCAAGIGVLPVISLRFLQAILDLMGGKNGITKYVVIYILFLGLTKVTQNVLCFIREKAYQAIRHDTEKTQMQEFLGLCMKISLLSFEQPDIHDRIGRLRNGLGDLYVNMMNGILTLCASVITVAGVFQIMAEAGWQTVLISMLVLLPVWMVNIRLTFKENKGWADNFWRVRRQQYYSDVISTRGYIRETRVFDSFGFFGRKWEESYDDYNRKLIRLTLTTRLASAGLFFLMGVGTGIVVYLLLPKLEQGIITIGLLVAVVEGLRGFSNDFIWGINGAVWGILYGKTLLGDKKALMELAKETDRREAAFEKMDWETEQVAAVPGIMEIDHVWFRYPNSKTYTLKGVTFTINAGEQIALVGENGSGKSTLAKLVLGLYEPEKGTIRYNGMDVSALTREQRKKIYGVVFQDYARYEITLRENMAFDNLEDQMDEEGYTKKLHAAGGDKILSYCKGLDTVLGKKIDGGVDLSNGQWQKLAIARALYHNAEFTVLDEPSSAADPLAEVEIYRQYAEMTRHTSGILITHRLGSVQFCDRILLLKDGEIAEEGTHDILIAEGGAYAQMYQMQKEWYI